MLINHEKMNDRKNDLITSYLKDAVCALQQETVTANEPVGNRDTSNAICHAIEAVFLHHLKGSSTDKHFWGLLKKVTHKSTRSQITELKQISTDIGKCRAWIRVVINDGALESYIRLIVADTSTLKYYYRPTAYLRDVEKPDIMLTYIQGLCEFSFNLSTNSTVLNQWTSTALVLSGLLPYVDLPRPIVSLRPSYKPLLGAVSSLGKRPASRLSNDISSLSASGNVSSADRPIDLQLASGANVGYRDFVFDSPTTDQFDLTQMEIDAIRSHDVHIGGDDNVKIASSSPSTPTSLLSHPDFIDPRPDIYRFAYNITPVSVLSNDSLHSDVVADGAASSNVDDTGGGGDDNMGQVAGPSFDDDAKRSEDQTQTLAEMRTNDSFASLLHSYNSQPSITPMTILSVEAIIETLPTENSTFPSSPSSISVTDKRLNVHVCTNTCDHQPVDCVDDDRKSIADCDMPQADQCKDTVNEDTDQLLIMHICNEQGLNRQCYQCHGCMRAIGMLYGKERLCNYDGFYYCFECHENLLHCIPARIVFNWDFRPYQVSNKSLDLLSSLFDQPLIHLDQVNLQLYDHVNSLHSIMLLRQQLHALKAYLYSCRQPVAKELLACVSGRSYLVDTVHAYTLKDLQHVTSGTLYTRLKKAVDYGLEHVYNCILCSQKGFICEICRHPKVIYPFELATTSRCEDCRAVFHVACKTKLVPCPRCRRRNANSRHLNPVERVSFSFTD